MTTFPAYAAGGDHLFSRLNFENLRGLAGELKIQHGLFEVVYGLEPTASYHKPLAEYLLRQNEQVVYVSNVAVVKNRALLEKNEGSDLNGLLPKAFEA